MVKDNKYSILKYRVDSKHTYHLKINSIYLKIFMFNEKSIKSKE